MDFINKLTHHDNDNNNNNGEAAHRPSSSIEPTTTTTTNSSGMPLPPTNATEAAIAKEEEPKRNFLQQLIAGSGGSHHSGVGDDNDDDDDDRLSFFDKLTRKEDREKKMLELVKREAEVTFELDKVAREKKENEGLLERLKDHFDGDNENAPPAPAPAEEEEDNGTKKPSSFFDKLTGKQEREQRARELAQRETALRAQLATIQHEKRENAGVLERLKQRLAQDEADGKDQTARAEDPSFFDRITGRAAEAERRRREEEQKTPLARIKDRIEEGMGGGQKAERKEDLLDKTIDGFQEHVLRKGDQSDESALEQLKDEQIASAIRNQLHIKKKEEDE